MEKTPEKNRERSFGIDLVRVTVLVLVFVLHYYYENGFYFQPVNSAAMFFHASVRALAMCSVPLFMCMTGWLRSPKLSLKSYCRPLLPVFISYALISLICALFNAAFDGESLSVSAFLKGLAGFTHAEYGWYINMYFGVFLLSPFINLLWKALETREARQRLLAALLLITGLASSVNDIFPVLPDYWVYLWPFVYYLLGAYIRSYPPKLSPLRGLLSAVAVAAAISAVNASTGGAQSFNKGFMPGYDELPCMLLTALIFCSLCGLDCSRPKLRAALGALAPRTLSMILISSLFNTLLYPQRYLLYGPESYFVQGLWRVSLSLFCSWCVAAPIDRLSAALSALPPPSGWRDSVKRRGWELFAGLGFAAALAFVVWKCRFGFGNMDEAFYLSIPIRLCQGDTLLVDEWHVSQLSAFLLYPVMKLYRLILGSGGEGIVLHFRYIYAFFQFVTALFLFSRWKRISKYGSFAAALLFLLFAPFSISALSYNSMGLICVCLALTLAITAEKYRGLQQLLSGVFLACAVLCAPAFALVWPLYGLAVLCFALPKLRRCRAALLQPAAFLRVTLGCAVVAALLAAFLLSRSSLSDILAAIPHILADPEHSPESRGAYLVSALRFFFAWDARVLLWSAAFGLVILLAALDSCRRGHAAFWWLCGCGCALGLMFAWFGSTTLISAVNAPLTLLPPLALILNRDGRIRKLFFGLWLPGVVYALCVTALSNQSYVALQLGLLPATAAAVMIVFETTGLLVREKCPFWWEPQRAAALVCAALILVGGVLGCTASRRFKTVHWENGIHDQTVPITAGPQAGLLVSQTKFDRYESARWEFSRLARRYPEAHSAAILSTECWYWLFSDWHNALYSSWLSARFEDIRPRVELYYELYPHKLPDIILADKALGQDWEGFAASYGYTRSAETGIFIVYTR